MESPLREIGYGMLLCVFVTVAAAVLGFGRHRESLRQLEEMRQNIHSGAERGKSARVLV